MALRSTTLFFVLLSAVLLATAYESTFSGPDYQGMNATQKASKLSSAVFKDRQSGPWPSAIESAEILLEDMNTSFDFAGDDFPPQGLFHHERKKLIHSVSSIATVSWNVTTTKYGYTGVFSSGCQNAYLRLSSAQKPVTSGDILILPGLGLKCLRNGVKSGNVVAMYSLLGTNNFNFFAHDFTNHVPNVNLTLASGAQKALLQKFFTASKWPTMVGLSDLAHYDAYGHEVSRPKFPFRLVFHPTRQVHSLFPSTPQGRDYVAQISTIKAGTPIYDIYAVSEPNGQPEQIGSLTATSDFTPSRFSDVDFFVQHQRMEDDVKYKPEWSSSIDKILAYQASILTPGGFVYPDLPFK